MARGCPTSSECSSIYSSQSQCMCCLSVSLRVSLCQISMLVIGRSRYGATEVELNAEGQQRWALRKASAPGPQTSKETTGPLGYQQIWCGGSDAYKVWSTLPTVPATPLIQFIWFATRLLHHQLKRDALDEATLLTESLVCCTQLRSQLIQTFLAWRRCRLRGMCRRTPQLVRCSTHARLRGTSAHCTRHWQPSIA